KGDMQTRSIFLAEREFTAGLESRLPTNAMVYQYPHSQYLRESRHYGWGAFSHIRLYLHSKGLRWSNGASKNSPVDNWHYKISLLPPAELLNEIESVGFKA